MLVPYNGQARNIPTESGRGMESVLKLKAEHVGIIAAVQRSRLLMSRDPNVYVRESSVLVVYECSAVDCRWLHRYALEHLRSYGSVHRHVGRISRMPNLRRLSVTVTWTKTG
jgi:hypothetical protein